MPVAPSRHGDRRGRGASGGTSGESVALPSGGVIVGGNGHAPTAVARGLSLHEREQGRAAARESGGHEMSEEHLPGVYVRFRNDYPNVTSALDGLGEAVDGAGPLDERVQRLVKLGLAIGGAAEGAVRSNARKALSAGATPEEVRHVALLAVTTCGFPAAIAGIGWIDEALSSER